jgi:hypothetical protein
MEFWNISHSNYEEFIKAFKKTPPNISPKLSPSIIWGAVTVWRDIRWTFFE